MLTEIRCQRQTTQLLKRRTIEVYIQLFTINDKIPWIVQGVHGSNVPQFLFYNKKTIRVWCKPQTKTL